MNGDKLRVFVSSSMEELEPERQVVCEALAERDVDAWLYEKRAGARTKSIQEVYKEEVEKADVYLGLFWKSYGSHTIKEYEYAEEIGKERLVYEKREDIKGRDTKLQKFLDRITDIEKGVAPHWFKTQDELRDYVKEDVARWQRDIVRRYHKIILERVHVAATEQRERDPEEMVLLDKVKTRIEGRLQQLVDAANLLDLHQQAVPELVEPPEEGEEELSEQPGRAMLIVGEPGSGKTITLLTMARELLQRAEADASQPIPVVLNLATWADERPPFADWLLDQLKTKFYVANALGRTWLNDNRLFFLLDGLDEVNPDNHRAACVEAINAFVVVSLHGLAVCSRLHEYKILPVRLKLDGAVCLMPLSREKMLKYVARAKEVTEAEEKTEPATDTPTKADLDALQALLRSAPDMRKLAQTPLLLRLMSQAYEGMSVETLAEAQPAADTASLGRLFDTYLQHRFDFVRRRAKRFPEAQRYDEAQTRRALAWLAGQMKKHNPVEFSLEQLQPSWLATQGQRRLYALGSRLAGGLLLGLMIGLGVGLIAILPDKPFQPESIFLGMIWGGIGGLIAGLLDARRLERGGRLILAPNADTSRHATLDVVLYVLSFTLIFALIEASLGWLAEPLQGLALYTVLGLIFGLFFGIRGRGKSLRHDIQSVEIFTWSSKGTRKGVRWGLLGGLAAGLIVGWIVGVEEEDFIQGVVVGLIIWFLAGLIIGLLVAVFGGLRGGILKQKAFPNQGIKLSIRNAASGALLVGGVAGLLIGPAFALVLLEQGVPWGAAFATFFGGLAGLRYGGLDAIQHYVLRLLLRLYGYTPPGLVRFLDYAARLIFLQKVGGGYIFIHRLLLEHFAAMRPLQGHPEALPPEKPDLA